jgi:hypothetical protein
MCLAVKKQLLPMTNRYCQTPLSLEVRVATASRSD